MQFDASYQRRGDVFDVIAKFESGRVVDVGWITQSETGKCWLTQGGSEYQTKEDAAAGLILGYLEMNEEGDN